MHIGSWTDKYLIKYMQAYQWLWAEENSLNTYFLSIQPEKSKGAQSVDGIMRD